MEEEKKEKQRKEEKALDKMTVKELRAIAMDIPRSTAVHDMKKDELIAFISEARGISYEKPVKAGKKFVKKIKLTKSEIKGKIRQLKREKKEAQSANSKKNSDFLRRRISYLKKQSRKFANA